MPWRQERGERFCVFAAEMGEGPALRERVDLAERLCAERPSEEAKLELATAFYRAGATSRAAKVLENCVQEPNRYLYAVCQMRLGELALAQRALLGPADALHVTRHRL